MQLFKSISADAEMITVLKVLVLLAFLSVVSGVGYNQVVGLNNPLLQTGYIALLYMPLPLYTLLIYGLFTRQNLVRRYLDISRLRQIRNFFITVGVFMTWIICLLVVTWGLNNLFPAVFARFVTDNAELLSNLTRMVGEAASGSANLPPHPLLLIPFAIYGAIMAGFSINLIFAFSEEVMWRGWLYDKLIKLGFWRGNMLIGLVWGLWHMPLILQGYNYGPGNGVVGSAMFTLFCITFSLLFGLVMRWTQSTIFAAALHGMFNGFAGIFVFLLLNANPFVDGAIGIVSVGVMLVMAGLGWATLNKIKLK